ncbi:TPA: phage/plasmid replication protein [Vibrio harveyi]|uniref:phage/plasmid replication domain-containing protein n=1 Tax=Vibrio harveyi TaxID=669 RepID=UPI00390A5E57
MQSSLIEWFIDKLNMQQVHPKGGLPVVGKELYWRVDAATGESTQPSPTPFRLEGSFSSLITVRCDGYKVSVEGNPSRWMRMDNLFGFKTIDECVAVYNRILKQCGLPPFTKSTRVYFRQTDESKKALLESDGAFIKHIDFTRNLSVGEGNEIAYLRAISGQTIGRSKVGYLYPNQQTVDWNKGSTYRYDKIYIKAFDLEKHRSSRTANCINQEDLDYYDQLIDYCKSNGVIREEHSFKRPFLRRKNLCFYGLVTEKDFEPYLQDLEKAMKRLEVTHTEYDTVADQLMGEGVCKSRQSANATQSVYLQWLHGQKLKRNSQYYVHRSRLLQIGIDIAVDFDVTRLPIQIRRQEVVEVQTLQVPDWYREPHLDSLPKVVGLDIPSIPAHHDTDNVIPFVHSSLKRTSGGASINFTDEGYR